MVSFIVIPQNLSAPSSYSGAYLEQDKWNDFNFQTQYHLHLATPEFTGRIGTVKILKKGQISADPQLLSIGPLEPFGEEWVSLGQNLDYYERLAGLPETLRKEILEFLRDALVMPAHAATFQEEGGWITSVMRYIDWTSFQRDASVLLQRDYTKVANIRVALEFHMRGAVNPLKINFAGPSDLEWFADQEALPDRMAVIVGRNGSGKSTLLSRLARVLHASQKDRTTDVMMDLGTVAPAGIGFTRIVNIAYSAFDTFQLPGVDYEERRQIADDLERGTGRYYYCGLRDIVKEVRRTEGIGDTDGQLPQPHGPDRQGSILLKSHEDLKREFVDLIKRIQDMDRVQLLREVCEILASDSSFADLGNDPTASILAHSQSWFEYWSTGHKVTMHAVASLVAHTEPKSIVLIDEPETHLHPPLLAALMHAIRLILRKNDAFAVIATHSPVVIQETLRRHISVVKRSGSQIAIHQPVIETYGESIGEITNEIFGLNADATDFHHSLSQLVEKGLSLDQIESFFNPGLSIQARAYVMTEIARKSN